MASFAERHGFVAGRMTIQTDSLDDDTRVRLWNVIANVRTQLNDNQNWEGEDKILRHVWAEFFKRPLDVMPEYDSKVWADMRHVALSGEWYLVFDLIEHFITATGLINRQLPPNMANLFDAELKTCLVGWRFVDGELVRVDRDEERESLVEALTASADISGANHHLNRALAHLSERDHPDYPNAVKEAVSAVEAVVRKVTGEGTLGGGLKKLEVSGLTIHPALKNGWDKLYGWASDADGVRHGSIAAADIDQTLAKYVVVTCSAFVSYLIEEGRKASLL